MDDHHIGPCVPDAIPEDYDCEIPPEPFQCFPSCEQLNNLGGAK